MKFAHFMLLALTLFSYRVNAQFYESTFLIPDYVTQSYYNRNEIYDNGYTNYYKQLKPNPLGGFLTLGNDRSTLYYYIGGTQNVWTRSFGAFKIISFAVSGTGIVSVVSKSGTTTKFSRLNSSTGAILGTEETFSTSNQIHGVEVDSQGNSYVVGALSVSGQMDIQLIKYNNSGAKVWTKTYNSFNYFGEHLNDFGYGIAINSNNEIGLVGMAYQVDYYPRIITIKCDTDGLVSWNNFDVPVQQDTHVNFRNLKIASNGDLYLLADGRSIVGYDHVVIRYSFSGNYDFNFTSSFSGQAMDFDISDLGNRIFVLGAASSFYGFQVAELISDRITEINGPQDGSGFFYQENAGSIYYDKGMDEVYVSCAFRGYYYSGNPPYEYSEVKRFDQFLNPLFSKRINSEIIVNFFGDYLRQTAVTNYGKGYQYRSCDYISSPSVTLDPVSQTVCVGQNVQFRANATGTVVNYLWKRNGVALSDNNRITGATSSVLQINNANAAEDAGNYYCEISDFCGNLTATFTATLAFTQQSAITNQPGIVTQCPGTEAIFQVTTTGGQNVKYQWRKGTTILTESASVVGTATNKLTLKSIASATAGDYYCYVTSDCFTVPQISQKGVLTVLPASAIIAQPQPVSACSGTNAVFTVSAAGTNVTYQWRKGTVNLTESSLQTGVNTNTLTIKNVASASAGDYNCVVSSTCGNVNTSTVALSVTTSPQITAQPTSRAVCTGTTITFSITATGASGFVWKRNDVALTNTGKYSGVNTATLTVTAATVSEAGTYTCTIANPCGNDLVSTAAQLTIASAPAITAKSANLSLCVDQPAIMSITATGSNLTYQWKKNGTNLNDAVGISGTKTSELILTKAKLTDAANYTCEVSSGCGASQVSGAIVLAVQAVVVISTQPQSRQGCQGDDVLFSIATSGAVQSLQWKKNGVNLTNSTKYAGALSNTLTIKNIQPADQAFYTCEVRTTCATTIGSETVQLLVNPKPDLELIEITCSAPFVAEWSALVTDRNNTVGTYSMFTEGDLTPIPDLMSIATFGTYVIVKNTGVCTDSVVWNNTCIITGVEDVAQQVTVFPNPSTGKFFIKHPPDVLLIRMFDSKGIEVLTSIPGATGETGIESENLPQGLYLVVTDLKDGRSVIKKMIVSR
jgi:hypothetical protein